METIPGGIEELYVKMKKKNKIINYHQTAVYKRRGWIKNWQANVVIRSFKL